MSGASLRRAGFEALMHLVEQRRADAVVTEDMSRISRDIADSAAVFRRLQSLDVPLIGVANGIDTSARSASIAFTVKALTSQLYLTDLADKTRRGLEGRALAGHSTGGLPYGYESTPESDGRGGIAGYRVVINEGQAEVVRRIFKAYANGMSYSGIAGMLNAEGVSPPRVHTRHRKKGWANSTIRAILHNESYVGSWSYPPESEVIRGEYPERRIVDDDLWNVVQRRLASVKAKYARNSKAPTAPGHRTRYPLSGLLFCGECGESMVITAGSSARYYICSHAKGRRTCATRLSVREDVLRRSIFAAIRHRLITPVAIEYLRKRIAASLGALARNANREIDERRARLERTEQRIAGLVTFLADGDRSDYVVSALRDLEAQALAEKREIAAIVAHAKTPVRLPTADQIFERALDLERTLAADPVRAPEALRRLLVDGVLVAAETAGAARVGVTLSVRLG